MTPPFWDIYGGTNFIWDQKIDKEAESWQKKKKIKNPKTLWLENTVGLLNDLKKNANILFEKNIKYGFFLGYLNLPRSQDSIIVRFS